MHGRNWNGQDVSGWYASEKLDGCRAYWDGKQMWTRSGRAIEIPKEWREQLPAMHLDGEIWAGRGKFQAAVNAVNFNRWEPGVCFMVFDAPEANGTWPERLGLAEKALRGDFTATIPWRAVESLADAAALFRDVHSQGGEGLMLYFPESKCYHARRCNHVLKLKRDPQAPVTKRVGFRITFGRAA